MPVARQPGRCRRASLAAVGLARRPATPASSCGGNAAVLRIGAIEESEGHLDWTRKSTKMRDMKSTRLNMHDAKTHLSRHIAALKGDDRIVICNRNRPVAEVRLLPGARARPRKPGLAKGPFTVPASFFEPLPEDLLAGFEGRG